MKTLPTLPYSERFVNSPVIIYYFLKQQFKVRTIKLFYTTDTLAKKGHFVFSSPRIQADIAKALFENKEAENDLIKHFLAL